MKTLDEAVLSNPEFVAQLHALVLNASEAGEDDDYNFLTFYQVDKENKIVPVFIVTGSEIALHGNTDMLVDTGGFTISQFLKF